MANGYVWGQGQQGGRVVSPQRPVQPTGFEPLAAFAQSWMGKQQAETKALQSAFPAMVAAKAIQTAKPGEEGAFSFAGSTYKFKPGMDYSTLNTMLGIQQKQQKLSGKATVGGAKSYAERVMQDLKQTAILNPELREEIRANPREYYRNNFSEAYDDYIDMRGGEEETGIKYIGAKRGKVTPLPDETVGLIKEARKNDWSDQQIANHLGIDIAKVEAIKE